MSTEGDDAPRRGTKRERELSLALGAIVEQVLRGEEAVAWQETHGDLRSGTCTKCGSFFHFDTFMVGNLLVSYQQHRGEEPSHCTKRVVLKVWRF